MPDRPTAVITETLDMTCADWLAARCDVVWAKLDASGPVERTLLEAALPEADALIVRTYTEVDEALLDRAPKLRVVGRAGVGLDNIDLDACKARGIPVVYTPDANTQAVVEYALGLMLDWARPRPPGEMRSAITAEHFHTLRKTLVGKQLSDLTLGVLGFGRIGSRLSAVATTLGMRVQATDVLPSQALAAAHPEVVGHPNFAGFVDHATLYATSDIVSIHIDGRAGNRRMFDAAAFSRLKPDALLLNAARGVLVDHAAAAAFATAHPAARLILDVHDPEPPPEDYPLWTVPNVTLMPHLASRTATALENMSWVVRDIVRVLEGQEPEYCAW